MGQSRRLFRPERVAVLLWGVLLLAAPATPMPERVVDALLVVLRCRLSAKDGLAVLRC